jgi:hypothetical protein
VERRVATLEVLWQRRPPRSPSPEPAINGDALTRKELLELDDLLAVAERAERQGAADGYTVLTFAQRSRCRDLWTRVTGAS